MNISICNNCLIVLLSDGLLILIQTYGIPLHNSVLYEIIEKEKRLLGNYETKTLNFRKQDVIWKLFLYGNISYRLQNKQIEENILKETKISREHLTPEIPLHLITPECRLFHEPQLREDDKVFENDPFWAFYWPGGQALSKFVLENSDIVTGKSILDVGSGCGATSIAAIKKNAKYAVANDIDDAASYAALLNAKLNKIDIAKLRISTGNLIGCKISEDIIFIGDLFYDEEIAEILLPWLHKCSSEGKLIFIGDPGRHGLTENRLNFMKKLATYELTENCCIENRGFRNVNVWRFR